MKNVTVIRRKTNKIESDPHINQILNPTARTLNINYNYTLEIFWKRQIKFMNRD